MNKAYLISAVFFLIAIVFSLIAFVPVPAVSAGSDKSPGSSKTANFDHSHRAFDAILKKYVKNGLVNYKLLKSERADLDAYLGTLATVTKSDFEQWSEPQQLAFLFNLYNAATLQLIIDNYPVRSIRKIGNIFRGPWDQKVVSLFGETTTLNKVEHSILRMKYSEPRLHFALVCAAISCPELRAGAYVGEQLDQQLQEQGLIFFRDQSKNRVDESKKILYLSSIFKWFAEDFEKSSGTVFQYVKQYFPDAEWKNQEMKQWRIRYLDYDWSLNELK